MKTKVFVVALLAAAISFGACKKKKDDTPAIDPTITAFTVGGVQCSLSGFNFTATVCKTFDFATAVGAVTLPNGVEIAPKPAETHFADGQAVEFTVKAGDKTAKYTVTVNKGTEPCN